MRLTKEIPARTKTISFLWCKKNFAKMSEMFRVLRASPCCCYWCKHKFVDDEMMALAQSEKGNKLLCQKCADELLKG